MNGLELIHQAAGHRGLRFLLIGGFAVNAHGYSRMTGDLDLAVPRSAREAWEELGSSLGYRLKTSAARFLQFELESGAGWPLDVMLANEPTFGGLWEASKEISVGSLMFHVVSLDHLIAMKLHVLKQARLHRFMKDYQDVVSLVLVNHLDVRSEKYRRLFEKYGNLDLYEKIVRSCTQP